MTTDPNTGIDLDAEFERFRLHFEQGDKSCALHALAFACYFDSRPPRWAIEHVLTGYRNWSSAEVRTMDEALGIKRPKGWQLRTARNASRYGGAIFVEVNKLLEKEACTDDVFHQVGKRRRIGKTAASEIYYGELRALEERQPGIGKAIKASRKKSKKPERQAKR